VVRWTLERNLTDAVTSSAVRTAPGRRAAIHLVGRTAVASGPVPLAEVAGPVQ